MTAAELRSQGRRVPRRRGKARILAEPSRVFVVIATELGFAARTIMRTLLPGVAITWRDRFKTESPRAFPAAATGHISGHPILSKLLSHCEASHALWSVIRGGAQNHVTYAVTYADVGVAFDAGTLGKNCAPTRLATCTTSRWLERQPHLALHAGARETFRFRQLGLE
jgi:hypothetical protein